MSKFEARFCSDVPGCLMIALEDRLVTMTQYTTIGTSIDIHGLGKAECEELIKACESRIKEAK